jgi:hypothetical protein
MLLSTPSLTCTTANNLLQQSILHLVLRLRGGGPATAEQMAKWKKEQAAADARKAVEAAEMTIAAGGTICQTIVKDTIAVKNWDKGSTVTFNLQIINAAKFESLLGIPAPSTPISKETYAEHGYPFFKLYEEKSGIKGDFGSVKSVSQLRKATGVHNADEDFHHSFPIVTLNCPKDALEKVWLMRSELEDSLAKVKIEDEMRY